MFNIRFTLIVRRLIAFFLVMQFISCYSPEEGCLDPEATNYDITGDSECLDCCKYPKLKLSVFHENRDTTFNLNDTIKNDLDQQISLLDFVILLSDFRIESNGVSYEVQDSISLNIDNGVLLVKDDVIRVSRNSFTYEVGTIIYNGNTENISFKIGLNNELNQNRFTNEINDHPLTNDPDSLFQDETEDYVFQRIKIAQGINFLDTVTYDVTLPHEVSFPFEYESIRGSDKTLIVEAQYDKWFEGIDFSTMSQTQIIKMIGENSANLFRQKN